MESIANIPPLVVIVGPTGSGKSSLAMELATRFNGEIICADSRTVYRGMDIGTAKPSLDDQRKVRHHLLDITTPDRPITAADFKLLAEQAVADIGAQGKVPFLVGGTGLYIDSVIFDFSFLPAGKPGERNELLGLSVLELQRKVAEKGLSLPENASNPRHLIRRIESGGAESRRSELRGNTVVIGLMPEQEDLKNRLAHRRDKMFVQGLEEEARSLVARYGWGCRALQTIGYQEFRPYFDGLISPEEVKIEILRNSLGYAKRQKTWFKRNKHIVYPRKAAESVDLITSLLNKSFGAD